MTTTYTPAAVELTTLTLPEDGELRNVASVNGPIKKLGDGVAWLGAIIAAHDGTVHTYTSLTAVEWTAGPFDHLLYLEGWGGGSGGGGGGAGYTSGYSCGGGGGGAPRRQRRIVSVTPGVTYEIICGAGGTGGAGGIAGLDPPLEGGPGGDTIIRIKSSGVVIARFKGAALGGRAGDLTTSSDFMIAPGGCPTTVYRPATYGHKEWALSFCFGPGHGGDGVTKQGVQDTRPGAANDDGYDGGAGGTVGADGGAYKGGGAGGGGAAGPGGAGVDGKSGGDGAASGSGSDAPLSGAGFSAGGGQGGGGGGGGGCGPDGGGDGSEGIGGNSGSLILRVIG